MSFSRGDLAGGKPAYFSTAEGNSDVEKTEDRRESVAAGVTGGKEGADNTHRKLKPRHVQLIGIGGTIGVSMEPAFHIALEHRC